MTTVLVTGGTGTLGQALVLKLLEQGHTAVVFSRDEVKQRAMKRRWPDRPNGPIRYFIGDVRDVGRLRQAFAGVDYVIHTAALKQVDTAEYNPLEVVRTNVDGTMNVVNAAVDAGVKKVVFTSSDKAVHPLNLYGATKMVAEKIVLRAHAYGAGRTSFAVTRWGNVIRSRGSVFDTWSADVGTPIGYTLDHRYWLTRDDVVLTVQAALTHMDRGEIFVPEMRGASMQVIAHAFVEAAHRGYPGDDRFLEEISSRFGDKPAESLFTAEELARTYFARGGFYVSLPPEILSWDDSHEIWLDGERALGLKAFPDSASCARWKHDELVQTLQEDMRQWP